VLESEVYGGGGHIDILVTCGSQPYQPYEGEDYHLPYLQQGDGKERSRKSGANGEADRNKNFLVETTCPSARRMSSRIVCVVYGNDGPYKVSARKFWA